MALPVGPVSRLLSCAGIRWRLFLVSETSSISLDTPPAQQTRRHEMFFVRVGMCSHPIRSSTVGLMCCLKAPVCRSTRTIFDLSYRWCQYRRSQRHWGLVIPRMTAKTAWWFSVPRTQRSVWADTPRITPQSPDSKNAQILCAVLRV